MSQDDVLKAIGDFADPETGRSVVQQGQVSDVQIQGNKLTLTLALTTHSAPLWTQTRERLAKKLASELPGLSQVDVRHAVFPRPAVPLGQFGLSIKSVIAVGSGKGGVGKSTIAASIAYGLKRAGSQVGLMDADVYGPSIPHLLGLSGRPEIIEGKIQPAMLDDIKVMSMGFLVAPGQAVVWRGPMLHGAITQFLRDTAWGSLDYLIIDMPPGTGDIALTLSQILPLTGAVVVCTPQDVALLDAVKAIAMFRQVNIPVLGMVENMSYFACPGCGKRYDIFGTGGAKKKAAELGIDFLGEVPICIPIREHGDQGRIAANFENPEIAPYLNSICTTLVGNLASKHAEKPVLPTLSIVN